VAKRDAATAGKLSAQLWAALSYLGKKRADRDQIPLGSTSVDVLIEGRIGRAKISEHVVGRLDVGGPTQAAASEAADADHLIAILLDAIPDAADRQQAIAKFHAANKFLPSIDPAKVEAAKAWRALLRSHTTKTKAGAITFEVSAETR
jgi:hypothetical protein